MDSQIKEANKGYIAVQERAEKIKRDTKETIDNRHTQRLQELDAELIEKNQVIRCAYEQAIARHDDEIEEVLNSNT